MYKFHKILPYYIQILIKKGGPAAAGRKIMVNLTEQQTFVVKNLMDQERMCVEKYTRGEKEAKDPVLKELFATIKKEEQQHYNSLSQLLEGNVPEVNTRDEAGMSYCPKATYVGDYNATDKENDKFLCTDAIATEKYVSSAYNYELFQFGAPNVRRLLNDMETEEQNHAEMIYKYKSVNGMTAN